MSAVRLPDAANHFPHCHQMFFKLEMSIAADSLQVDQAASHTFNPFLHEPVSKLKEHLMTVREMISGIGEAHSAHNTMLLLRRRGVNAEFVDLSGWRESESMSLEDRIRDAFVDIDVQTVMLIVTGYTQAADGLMGIYGRGYSEVTFSAIACVTSANEAVIHKEFHLSSADPRIVGADKVQPIGRTNYDVADQLSNMGMEAIHPRAQKPSAAGYPPSDRQYL